MTERRFSLGVFLTVAWLLTMALLFYWSETQAIRMKPNEWGDFFAGVFAPLAFLWLVLGYLQQGEELRLSTAALRLQADELKNSVAQQRELVQVTKLQLDAEREKLVYERDQREAAAKPSLLISGAGGSFRGDGKSTYSFVLSNSGNAAMDLIVEIVSADAQAHRLLDEPLFERGKRQGLTYEISSPLQGNNTRLQLAFKDILGKQYQILYAVERAADHPNSVLSFTKLEG